MWYCTVNKTLDKTQVITAFTKTGSHEDTKKQQEALSDVNIYKQERTFLNLEVQFILKENLIFLKSVFQNNTNNVSKLHTDYTLKPHGTTTFQNVSPCIILENRLKVP